jgi:hypothetical protein
MAMVLDFEVMLVQMLNHSVKFLYLVYSDIIYRPI